MSFVVASMLLVHAFIASENGFEMPKFHACGQSIASGGQQAHVGKLDAPRIDAPEVDEQQACAGDDGLLLDP
jgi:hypothetical protein